MQVKSFNSINGFSVGENPYDVISNTGNITGNSITATGLITTTGNITGNYFIGNGSQLSNITGANVTGNVTSATTTYNANVATVSNNQEYRPLLATNTVGNLSFRASAGISWNPSTYGLTAGKILLGSGIGAQGVTGVYAYGANTAWQVQSQNGTGTDALGQEIGRFGSEYTSGVTTFWDSYVSYHQGSGSNSGWLKINAAGNSVANVTGTGISVTGTASATGNITGNYFIGNGSQLTGVSTSANTIFNGNSNVSVLSSNGNITMSVTGTNNVLIVSSTGANIAGTVHATGNVTGSNLTTAGVVSATGNVTSGNLVTTGNIVGNTNGFTIGYLNIPQVTASNVTLSLTDAGKHYYSNTNGNLTLTIPTNANTAFATGTAISIVIQAVGNILVNATSGVSLYMAGNSIAANRAIGGYGMATLMKVSTDTWFINGTGIS
jgi:hypothetical protein